MHFYEKQVLVFIAGLLLFSMNLSGQSILAGDTSAPGIIYNDIDDISLNPSPPYASEAHVFDFNNDGIEDLKFKAYINAEGMATVKQCLIYGLNGTQTVYYEPNPLWEDELQDGALIDENSLWNDARILKSQYWGPDTIEEKGIFSWGYVGFEIPADSEYLYGWIHLYVTYDYIHIHDYAYQSMETGINDQIEGEKIQIYPNPASSRLNILLPPGRNYSDGFVYSSSGQLLLSFSVDGQKEKLSIDVSSLQDGIYILKMNGQSVLNQKFIKSSF